MPASPLGDPPPFTFEADAFARLLVRANELLEDADRLREYASTLQQRLLDLYRFRILDPNHSGAIPCTSRAAPEGDHRGDGGVAAAP